MKITTEIIESLKDDFKITEEKIAGEKCLFIRPNNIMCNWNESNLMFRTTIWNSKLELISTGYPKFFNFEEKPALHPFGEKSLYNCSITEKVDGSCLIVSKYNGELIVRTRGTVNVNTMPNSYEITRFKDKMNHLLNGSESSCVSYLFEWVSPTNVIILNYGNEPDFYLTGVVHHDDCSLLTQDQLDLLSNDFKRPTRYKFYGISELMATVSKWEGKEGVCLYYDNDQHIRKIKSTWYLSLHLFKSRCSLRSILDLYFEWDQPTEKDFRDNLEIIFDYECLKMSDSLIKVVYDKVRFVDSVIEQIKQFVTESVEMDQKDFAFRAKEKFPICSYTNIAFALRKNASIIKPKRNILEEMIKTGE